MSTRAAVAVASLFVAAALGCGDGGGDAGPGSVPDAAAVSHYPEVREILVRSCAIERCHTGPVFGAGLYLDPESDLRARLVGVPACQYERMALVEPGRPERSWLMVKLTAPFRGQLDPYANYIEFTPAPDWDPSARGCPDETGDGHPLFGQRMPATAPNQLPDAELQVVEAWIAQGAPP